MQQINLPRMLQLCKKMSPCTSVLFLLPLCVLHRKPFCGLFPSIFLERKKQKTISCYLIENNCVNILYCSFIFLYFNDLRHHLRIKTMISDLDGLLLFVHWKNTFNKRLLGPLFDLFFPPPPDFHLPHIWRHNSLWDHLWRHQGHLPEDDGLRIWLCRDGAQEAGHLRRRRRVEARSVRNTPDSQRQRCRQLKSYKK